MSSSSSSSSHQQILSPSPSSLISQWSIIPQLYRSGPFSLQQCHVMTVVVVDLLG
ncbi:MAG TPA: hypothetical protein VE573_15005 [Nitrososphaeraceae archaeon]|nr:hypothetical protein [Nitrososphaeraceae archaeon]